MIQVETGRLGLPRDGGQNVRILPPLAPNSEIARFVDAISCYLIETSCCVLLTSSSKDPRPACASPGHGHWTYDGPISTITTGHPVDHDFVSYHLCIPLLIPHQRPQIYLLQQSDIP